MIAEVLRLGEGASVVNSGIVDFSTETYTQDGEAAESGNFIAVGVDGSRGGDGGNGGNSGLSGKAGDAGTAGNGGKSGSIGTVTIVDTD